MNTPSIHPLIQLLKKDVDKDIMDPMTEIVLTGGETYYRYELLQDPITTLIAWQQLRDDHKYADNQAEKGSH